MDDSKINRFEIIDHRKCEFCLGSRRTEDKKYECLHCYGLGSPGRSVVAWDDNIDITTSIQDDGRTLKVFIQEKQASENNP